MYLQKYSLNGNQTSVESKASKLIMMSQNAKMMSHMWRCLPS